MPQRRKGGMQRATELMHYFYFTVPSSSEMRLIACEFRSCRCWLLLLFLLLLVVVMLKMAMIILMMM